MLSQKRRKSNNGEIINDKQFNDNCNILKRKQPKKKQCNQYNDVNMGQQIYNNNNNSYIGKEADEKKEEAKEEEEQDEKETFIIEKNMEVMRCESHIYDLFKAIDESDIVDFIKPILKGYIISICELYIHYLRNMYVQSYNSKNGQRFFPCISGRRCDITQLNFLNTPTLDDIIILPEKDGVYTIQPIMDKHHLIYLKSISINSDGTKQCLSVYDICNVRKIKEQYINRYGMYPCDCFKQFQVEWNSNRWARGIYAWKAVGLLNIQNVFNLQEIYTKGKDN